MKSGTIFDIKRYAIHDGPGIRTTVFFKGCPLSCSWCHNPEGIPPEPVILHNPDLCVRCETCLSACPKTALSMNSEDITIDRNRCDLCLACVEACPANALAVMGKDYSVDELMMEIEKDIPFFKTSGGGVTFSGGEPLMQPEFLLEVLKNCGKKDIHRTVDTCGLCAPEVLRTVAAETDLFLYDIKLMDSVLHQNYTGTDNRIIFQNLELLADVNRSVEVRFPLIPGINDDPSQLDQLGSFLQHLGHVSRVCVLPYHDFQMNKYRRLNIGYTLPEIKPPDTEAIERVKRLLEGYNLEVTVGG